MRTDFASELQKIDKKSVDGLSGVEDSLAYKINEIEKHFHNQGRVYGVTATNLVEFGLSPVIVTGGQQVWGTEIMVYDGSTIESGSSTKKMDMHELQLTNTTAVGRPTYIQFYYGSAGSNVAATLTLGDDKVNKVAHGLSNGNKVMFNTVASGTALNAYTVYYVINKADDTFEISLTLGGAAVNLDADTTCNYTVLTQTHLTAKIISASGIPARSAAFMMTCPRVTCNNRIWARAMTTTANTNALEFYLGIHTYEG